jgi:hypothetical protein
LSSCGSWSATDDARFLSSPAGREGEVDMVRAIGRGRVCGRWRKERNRTGRKAIQRGGRRFGHAQISVKRSSCPSIRRGRQLSAQRWRVYGHDAGFTVQYTSSDHNQSPRDRNGFRFLPFHFRPSRRRSAVPSPTHTVQNERDIASIPLISMCTSDSLPSPSFPFLPRDRFELLDLGTLGSRSLLDLLLKLLVDECLI